MADLRPSSILYRAADLCERGWTQHTSRRDAFGHAVLRWDQNPVCWCASGAIDDAAGAFASTAGTDAAIAAEEQLGAYLERRGLEPNVEHWNDAPGRTQAEVVTALREASKSC